MKQTERDRLQQEFIGGARERLHESRARLTLIAHYLDAGEYGKLRAYLDEQLGADCRADHRQYTGNDLVDAVLAAEFSRAEGEDIYIEQDLSPLPEALPYEDGDLISLLLNLPGNERPVWKKLPDGVPMEFFQDGGDFRLRLKMDMETAR